MPLANAIVRVRQMFEQSPWLRDNNSEIAYGCGDLTWRDLEVLVTYAAEQFDKNG